MAEVSITLADCEQALGTEFHEVTVTRRVFRTGEGEYFVNKTPCRLKDIQRLFMDTGIGTNSYSLMEQGRIDQILSSRPEDRREVFEEASGITKFKADKKEAIRKLDHTEANLVRLADIIREVRRQIISLQRQAGKAKRYKSLQEQLRGFDIYATRERLNTLNQDINTLESRLSSVSEQEEAVRADVDQTEQQATQTRAELNAFEKQIADAMEAAVQARNDLGRAHELIQINQDRIQELKDLSERDSRDCQEARSRLDQHRISLEELLVQLQEAIAARDLVERELRSQNEQLVNLDAELEQARKNFHDLGAESVDLESRFAKLQNELYTLDAQERASAIRKERLAAEQAELQRSVEVYEGRQSEMGRNLQTLGNEVEIVARRLKDLTAQRGNKARAISGIQKEKSDIQARIAARKAQIELLGGNDAKTEGFPGGARALLDSSSGIELNRAIILGSLAEQIRTEPPYRTAVEAALRAWLDAVVVSDDAFALEILQALRVRAEGSARIVALKCGAPAPETFVDGPGSRLIDHVQCSAEIRPLMERLLHNVRVVDELIEIPLPLRPEAIYVTRTGAVIRGGGSFEIWMPEAGEINPIARQHTLAEWSQDLAALEKQRDELDRNPAVR
jgi:chromosome segregation protein